MGADLGGRREEPEMGCGRERGDAQSEGGEGAGGSCHRVVLHHHVFLRRHEEGLSTRAMKGGAAPMEEQRATPEKGPSTGAGGRGRNGGRGATEERMRAWRETTTTVFLGPAPEPTGIGAWGRILLGQQIWGA